MRIHHLLRLLLSTQGPAMAWACVNRAPHGRFRSWIPNPKIAYELFRCGQPRTSAWFTSPDATVWLLSQTHYLLYPILSATAVCLQSEIVPKAVLCSCIFRKKQFKQLFTAHSGANQPSIVTTLARPSPLSPPRSQAGHRTPAKSKPEAGTDAVKSGNAFPCYVG